MVSMACPHGYTEDGHADGCMVWPFGSDGGLVGERPGVGDRLARVTAWHRRVMGHLDDTLAAQRGRTARARMESAARRWLPRPPRPVEHVPSLTRIDIRTAFTSIRSGNVRAPNGPKAT